MCGPSSLASTSLLLLLDLLLDLFGDLVNHILCLLADLLRVPLFLLAPLDLLLSLPPELLLDGVLQLLDLGKLDILGLLQLTLSLLIQVQVKLRLLQHLSQIGDAVLTDCAHETKLQVGELPELI